MRFHVRTLPPAAAAWHGNRTVPASITPAIRKAMSGRRRTEIFISRFLTQTWHRCLTDRYVAGKDFPRIAETTLAMSPDGRELLISVANGDGGEFEQFLVGADGEVKKVTHFDDKVVHAAFGPKDALYLLSRRQSDQGSILRLAADDVNFADAKTIISAPGKASLVSNGTGFPMSDRSYWVGENRIYATVIDGGPEGIRVFDHDGTALRRVPTPPVSSVSYLVPLDANAILYGVQTYTVPETWYRYTGSGQPEATGFRTESNVKLEDIEVRRAFARSKDGSEISADDSHEKRHATGWEESDLNYRLRRIRN